MCSSKKQEIPGEAFLKTSPEYPIDLLPRADYREIDFKTFDTKDVYLQRKCWLPWIECCVDGNPNEVTIAAFGKPLHKLSVNLLGALFRIGDECWHQNVTSDDDWTSGNVNLKDFEGKYSIMDIQASIYFEFDKANEIKTSFPRTFPDEQTYIKYKDAIIEGMSEKDQFSAKREFLLKIHSRCTHAPNKLNFWHVEVGTIIESVPEEEVDSNRKKHQERATKVMVEQLRTFSSLTPPSNFATIPEGVYKI